MKPPCESINQSGCLQMVHPGRILKLRVRGTKKDLMQDSSTEELCVVMPGVIARFDGSDIQVVHCGITFCQLVIAIHK